MIVVLLGPQGSGKGTQADLLEQRLGLIHVASGDVLRAARAGDSELGATVRRYYDAGELVPDEITIQLLLQAIREASDRGGVLLDGFPRTVLQARALDAALSAEGERVGCVVDLTAPLDVVRERLVGRMMCRSEGHIYNTATNPPRVAGICDVDGSELYQRPDDYPEAIAKRLAIWAEENGALEEYYRRSGVLRTVDANRDRREVADELVALLRDGCGAGAEG